MVGSDHTQDTSFEFGHHLLVSLFLLQGQLESPIREARALIDPCDFPIFAQFRVRQPDSKRHVMSEIEIRPLARPAGFCDQFGFQVYRKPLVPALVRCRQLYEQNLRATHHLVGRSQDGFLAVEAHLRRPCLGLQKRTKVVNIASDHRTQKEHACHAE